MEKDLTGAIQTNKNAIRKALIRIENRERKKRGEPRLRDDAKIFLSNKENDGFRLLNWRAWSLRYGVSIEFVVETMIVAFKKHRRVDADSNRVQLGLAATAVTGVGARKILEMRIREEFPNRENRRALARQRSPIRIEYSSPDELVGRYAKEMAKRREGRRRMTRNFRNRDVV